MEEDLSSGNPPESEPGSKPVVTFLGNSYDLTAVVGVTAGAVALFSCFSCGFGYYCLPVVSLLLGIVGLVAAKDSVVPERTKLLSWLSIGAGAIVILFIVVILILYVALIVFAIAAEEGGF